MDWDRRRFAVATCTVQDELLMGITALDLTIEEEEKAIVQLIEQAVHLLGGTMFVTGARRHEPALHPDSEQTPGCLRLIGDMGAHEVGLHRPIGVAHELL